MLDYLQSYSLHDLLIFSPESFFKLFELSNKALWPFHIPLLLSALVVIFLLVKRHQQATRFIFLWLVLVWGFVGFWYFGQFYSQINTYAHFGSYFFYAQAALLFLFAIFSKHGVIDENPSFKKWQLMIGGGLVAYGLLIHPIVSLIIWEQPLIRAELFSMAPDPTAIATIGFLFLMRMKGYLLLLVIPSVWLSLSVMTYSTF